MGDEMTAGFCLAAGIIWRLIGFRLVDQDEAAGGVHQVGSGHGDALLGALIDGHEIGKGRLSGHAKPGTCQSEGDGLRRIGCHT